MIQVEHLTKYYGDFLAVDDLSFTIDPGNVYGFLGPNGAGKSTTMNMITGCLSPTEGKIRIGGVDIFEEPEKAKRMIGYLPEIPPLYMNETPVEYLTFIGEAKGIRGEKLRKEIEKILEETGLEKKKYALISSLSKGYKQRVGIAQALIGNPDVIILDEPTVGLDPIQIIEIRDLIQKLGESHTVIFSSHILSEVQQICKKVLIISGGKLVAYDTPEELEKKQTKTGEITFAVLCDEEKAGEVFEGLISDEKVETRTVEDGEESITEVKITGIERSVLDFSRDLFFLFSEAGIPIVQMSSKKLSLEDVFIKLTENESEEERAGEEQMEKEQAVEDQFEEQAGEEQFEEEQPVKEQEKEEQEDESDPEA